MNVEARVRRIVKLAAAQTRIHAVKRWLVEDERGVHEQHAAVLLEKTAASATELGLTESQVDAVIALEIVLAAAQAMLRHAQKAQPS